jgi:hypothetical protein
MCVYRVDRVIYELCFLSCNTRCVEQNYLRTGRSYVPGSCLFVLVPLHFAESFAEIV